MKKQLSRRFCVAPMMDWSDRHYRYFARLISKHAVLYTEMVTTYALLHGDPARHLRFNAEEHPVALQLGGSDPTALGQCAKLGEDWGYDEINLNVGCPSDRVQEGRFGACLMAEPQTVADGVKAMRDAVAIPVTVKTRIGIDERDSYGELCDFIGTVKNAGCEVFIIHARKAWLKGLSPKENREIPPLQYHTTYQLKKDFPDLEIIINGGITDWAQIDTHMQHVDGVMLGREAYHNPYVMAPVDSHLYGVTQVPRAREHVLDAFAHYAERELGRGSSLQHLTRHILGLFQHQNGARAFRRYLSEHAHQKGAGIEVLRAAQRCMHQHS